MAQKKRLDILVLERLPAYSRNYVHSLIMQGKVLVNGRVINKAGTPVADDAVIDVIAHEPKFVSRAGFKLEKALDTFGIEVRDLTIMDAGLSTGGFSDCLLQRGAKKIYGVDVGYGQVHEKIRTDPRVVVMERTNLREVRDLGEKVDLVTLDLSFISMLKVMDAVSAVLKDDGQLVVLIKPQFEAGRDQIESGGLITDPKVHQEVIASVTQGVKAYGFELVGVVDSPIEGATGNKEFLAYFKRKSAS